MFINCYLRENIMLEKNAISDWDQSKLYHTILFTDFPKSGINTSIKRNSILFCSTVFYSVPPHAFDR